VQEVRKERAVTTTNQSIRRAAIGAALFAAFVSVAAWAAPVNLPPGATNISVPTFSGTPPTNMTVVGNIDGKATMDGITLQYDELAYTSSANPDQVVFALVVAASNTPSSLTFSLTGFSGLNTAVEACAPTPGTMFPSVCSSMSGLASRSTGAGDTLSFAGIGTTAIAPPPGGTGVNISDVYGIFASGSPAPGMNGSIITVVDDGTTFTFQGLTPTSVPEPGTVALLTSGLAVLWLVRRRATRSRRSTS
jgi:hypothetical protein